MQQQDTAAMEDGDDDPYSLLNGMQVEPRMYIYVFCHHKYVDMLVFHGWV